MLITNSNLNSLITNSSIALLNGATGTLTYILLAPNVYIVTGYVYAPDNRWFANFPVVPITGYANQNAKLLAINADGNLSSININSNRGMTFETTGEYWITGILYS